MALFGRRKNDQNSSDSRKDSSRKQKTADRPGNSAPDPDSYVYSKKAKKAKADPGSYVYGGAKAGPSGEAKATQIGGGKASSGVKGKSERANAKSGAAAAPGKPNRKSNGGSKGAVSGKKPAKGSAGQPGVFALPWKRSGNGEGTERRMRLKGSHWSGGEVFQDMSETDPNYWNKSLEQRYEENYPAERRILLRNIRRVAAVILAMFLGLMSYLVYFQVTKAEDLRADSGNRRNAEARNRVLRGTLYDRGAAVLSARTLHDDGTQTREYRGGAAFGNILGYVSDKYSITGLEHSLDKTLSQGAGLESFFTLDFVTSLLDPEQAVTRKQEGHSVTLTLDKELQRYAYEVMDGRKGSVVALDPKTGQILAMVSSPGFSASDLDEVMARVNEDEDYAAKAPLINRAVNSLYAPGSTMKVVTLASALQHLEGVEDRIFDDQGVIEFPDGSIIRNFNDNVYGEMDLQESFTNSSNYVFGNLGIELTNGELKSTAESLGFNQEITMEGLTARASVFPRLGEREQGNKALCALGQGEVAATPLQIAMVSAAVANDGMLASPYIVSRVTDKEGQLVEETEPRLEEALSPAIAGQVHDMMAENTVLGGSAYRSLADIDGAGKTGTGQFEVGEGTRVNAWFTGFAPAEDPKIAIAVVLEDLADINDNTGARQALPIAREIMTFWLDR